MAESAPRPATAFPDAAALKTVLVADDDPHVRRLLLRALSRDGYCTLSADDGEEALRIAREHHPQLILLDAAMPKLDGFEVCCRLKSDPSTQDIPVIMLTAKAQESDRDRGKAAGVDEYITKPFSPRELLDRLNGKFTLK